MLGATRPVVTVRCRPVCQTVLGAANGFPRGVTRPVAPADAWWSTEDMYSGNRPGLDRPCSLLALSVSSLVLGAAPAIAAYFEGTDGDDVLHGTASADLIDGMDGNDELYGHAGDDTLRGDLGSTAEFRGRDLLRGGAGNDTLHGDLGDDVLRGSWGDDRFLASPQDFLGPDRDRFHGGPGNDAFVRLGGGDLFVHGDEGDDVVTTAAFEFGTLVLHGDEGDDSAVLRNVIATVYGGPGDDVVEVDEATITGFRGGAGDDLLSMPAADLIGVAPGPLQGGSGDDTFLIRNDDPDDVRCGPGEDTVRADQADTAAADCEIVRRG